MIGAMVLFLFCFLLAAVTMTLFWFFQIRFGRAADLNPDSVPMRLFSRWSVDAATDEQPAMGSPSEETDESVSQTEPEKRPYGPYELLEWSYPTVAAGWFDFYRTCPTKAYATHHGLKPVEMKIGPPAVWVKVPCRDTEAEKLLRTDVTGLALVIKRGFDDFNKRLEAIESLQSSQRLLPFDIEREMAERDSGPVRPN